MGNDSRGVANATTRRRCLEAGGLPGLVRLAAQMALEFDDLRATLAPDPTNHYLYVEILPYSTEI